MLTNVRVQYNKYRSMMCQLGVQYTNMSHTMIIIEHKGLDNGPIHTQLGDGDKIRATLK